jgi:hypothetical protein
MAPLRELIQELLDSGVYRDHRGSKWSRRAWLIRPGNLGQNHPRLLTSQCFGSAMIRSS